MKDVYNEAETDGVILVDASNAFNALNRMVALHNISIICPPFANILINTYRMPSRLLVTGGGEIQSQQGTTQEDNIAMALYGLGTNPLLKQLKLCIPDIKQVWLADDATGPGKLHDLKGWWEIVIDEGQKLGYYVNQGKSWLILKDPNKLEEAKQLFADTNINFTTQGKRHLGAAIGSTDFKATYHKSSN